MNLKIWLLLIIIAIGSSIWFLTRNAEIVPSSISPQNEIAEQEEVGIPKRLFIPRLGVDTAVEEVGLDSQRRMDVPSSVDNVGWYNLGYKPGERGGAVIDGHLDRVGGAPAVFFRLATLEEGDQILVTDDKGKTLTFVVTDNLSYPFDKVPLNQIFGSSDKPMLNLITCVGTWDVGTQNYSNRQVVYSKLAT